MTSSQVLELYVAKKGRSPLDAVPGPMKTMLTREYNKMEHALSTVTGAKIGLKGKQDDAVTKRKMAAAVSGVVEEEEDGEVSDESADSDVELAQFAVKKGKGKSGAKSKVAPKRKAPAKSRSKGKR